METYIKLLSDELPQGALGIFAETAVGCLSLSPEENIYSFLARQVCRLVPESVVVFTSTNPVTRSGVIRAVAGFGAAVSGIDPAAFIGRSVPLPDYAVQGLASDALLELPGGVEAFSLGVLDAAAARELTRALSIEKAYVAGILWKGELLGSVGILARRGHPIGNVNEINALLRLMAVALHRHFLEHELQESQHYLTTLFTYAPDPYYLVNAKGELLRVNRAAEMLLGYSSEELEGRNVLDLDIVAPEYISYMQKAHRQHIREGSSEPYELELLHRKGRRIFVEVRSIPIVIEGKTVSLGIARNVSDRKNMETELKDTLNKLRKTLGGTIEAMARTVESRDPYTAGHQHRVSDLARAIGHGMGLSADSIDGLRLAGQVHDIGKIGVPVEMLAKPGKLSSMEFEIIKAHSTTGYEILKDIDFPWPIANIVLQHHERIDGSGYPRGLKGDEILIESQIIAVADVVEAMASHRPYRAALGIDVALNEIRKNRGRLYNPDIADTCLRLFDEEGFTLS